MFHTDRHHSGQMPIINGSFSGNVNSNNFIINGDPDAARGMLNLIGGGFAHNGGPPRAPQSQSTEWHARTQGQVSIPAQSEDPEPRGNTQEPAPQKANALPPSREPPAWKFDYEIGKGSFGAVFLEKVQMSGMKAPELWAVKRVSRTVPNFPAKQYENEVKNLKALSDHEWFVKFISSYEDKNYMYIAMEYIPMGDMSKTFAQGYRWNEGDTKVVIQQLLHGLAAMHKEGITHRDLKPENIFLCLPEGQPLVLRVKIGDFGASKHVPASSCSTWLKTSTGTEDYMAPEMDETDVVKTNAVDIWSLGCILFKMVAGGPLFFNRNGLHRYTIIASSPPESVKNRGFSVACEDFLRDVLQPSPGDRPSAEACLQTAWITSKAPGSEYAIGRDLYSRLSKIKSAAPDIDTLSDAVAHRAANSTPPRSFTTGSTLVTDSRPSVLRSAWTFDSSTLRNPWPPLGR